MITEAGPGRKLGGTWRRWRTPLLLLAIFAAALALRLPGLAAYLTPDEGQWAGNTARFMDALARHDWLATTTMSYPGITTTWAGSAGVVLKWFFARPPGMTQLSAMWLALAATPTRLDFLPWLRLAVALASSMGVVIIYWLARRLFDGRVALLTAAFLICDPFLLAYSKVLHVDALLTTNMTVAWLALLVATRARQRRYFVLSGVAASLGMLTKSPSLIIGPLMLGWLLLMGWRGRRGIVAVGIDLLWVAIPAVVTLWLLWPALWVAPLQMAAGIWGITAAFSQTGHELGNFWRGLPVADPGPFFYPMVLALRGTPVLLAGLGLAAVATLVRRGQRERGIVWALWAYVLWYAFMMSLGDKKFDRYLLPAWPVFELLAAWGWVSTLRWAARVAPGRFDGLKRRQTAWPLAIILLAMVPFSLALANRPSYLTTFNPLLGGLAEARQVMLVGWGEGLAEAAGYLNGQPDAEQQHVAAWYGTNVFGPYYAGHSYDLYYDTPRAQDLYARDVDWVVTYVNQQQRDLLDPGIQAALAEPVFSSRYQGVSMAQVYRWPKPYAHTLDRPLAPGLRLLGWTAGSYDPTSGRLQVELHWDTAELRTSQQGAGGTSAAVPLVSVWLKDAAGEVWATTQGKAMAGEMRCAAGWLGREDCAQVLTLEVPPGLVPGSYTLEMAPERGRSQGLGHVQIEPTKLAPGTPLTGIQSVHGDVTFGGEVRLMGYAVDRRGGELVLDLLWSPLRPQVAPRQLFVHAVDASDRIIAQFDGPLAHRPANAAEPGTLLRQRVHLQLPLVSLGAPASFTLYAGLYGPGSGDRLAVTADGESSTDGRYRLATLR